MMHGNLAVCIFNEQLMISYLMVGILVRMEHIVCSVTKLCRIGSKPGSRKSYVVLCSLRLDVEQRSLVVYVGRIKLYRIKISTYCRIIFYL